MKASLRRCYGLVCLPAAALVLFLFVFAQIDRSASALAALRLQPVGAWQEPDREIFTDVSQAAGIQATHRGVWDLFDPDFESGYLGVGQAWGDYDNDGWLDLFVTGNMEPNVLYRNNGDGTFSVSPLSDSVSLPDKLTGGAVWADYDNDGWRDLYILAHGANLLFHNQAGTALRDVTAQAGVGDTGKGSTATWGDYDVDGYLDLYVVNWACFPECDPLDNERAADRLYHNNGDGTFSDVSDLLAHEKLLGAGFTASFVDYDDDGDLDLYVVNDALKNPIGNVLWRNDGPGCGGWCWADVSKESGANTLIDGMGLAVGDYDNDLDLDFYFTNMVNSNALLQNQSNGVFVDRAYEAKVEVGPSSAVKWGTSFFDYNNDGWLDLSTTTTEFIQIDIQTGPEGMMEAFPNTFFENNGDGTFTDITPPSWLENPVASMGFAYADYDQDGWVDFVMGNWNTGYALFRNEGLVGAENHWLSLRLVGTGPINRDAVGTRVYLTDNNGRTQMQEVKSGSSLGAGNDTALHFGLGQARPSQVKIRWPNGDQEVYRRPPVDQIWQVSYGDAPVLWPWLAAAFLLGALLILIGGVIFAWQRRFRIVIGPG